MRNKTSVDEIENHILKLLAKCKKEGNRTLELRAGDIHSELELQQRIVQVCLAMKRTFRAGDQILTLPRRKLRKGYEERKPHSGKTFESQCEEDGKFCGCNLAIIYSTDR
jgi:hypothetical protein